MVRRSRVGAAVLASIVVGCGQDGRVERGASGSRSDAELTGEVLVSAATSLTDAFEEVESAFEMAHPGVDVLLNLGASSSLRAQILEGAPVDVFASANAANMDRVAEAGAVAAAPRVFARNLLQIAVPAGNPAGVRGLEDLASEALRVGLCAERVPCGDFARLALQRAGVVASLDTEEPDVRALLTKLQLGELDAGITYVTDVASAGASVEGIDIAEDMNVVAEYPIAVLAAAPNRGAADAFVRFVLSDDGRAILARHGFAPP